ncbi:glycosyltransferase family 2 protein [Limosilactobacillus agrestimuris]|uniref:glycosyltransferase family 2 protein n=1 Tax=Limosilactobacillus agrestimuris TaxID=2941331 RepID=UPI0020424303|nr:glycosyltransferase family 2 protein [Limosilactobacillus agrestimuris]
MGINNGKKVTVLMSTYNGERYLRQQIETILKQQGIQVQLLVRDDGSTDRTLSILNEYQDNTQLHYYSGPNLKTARSFMQLIFDSPKSDYYAFSDQDDVWNKNKINRAISLLEENDHSIPMLYAGNFKMTDKDLNPISGGQHFTTQKFANAIVYSCCTGCTMVMNKKLRDILRIHPIPKHLLMHDDWIHKVCLAIGGKVVFDSKPMMFYRQHGNNVDGGIHTINDKIQKVWNEKHQHSRIMSSQLSDLLKLYGEQMPKVNRELLQHALDFGKGSLVERMRLAFDPTYEIHENRNLNHEFRISLLMNYW